jgi:UDP:flavonoid glycosyltransferase YjiC (YdhE family)
LFKTEISFMLMRGVSRAALYNACPLVTVPVYGDQMYWADAASSFGIGPLNPVSLQHITHEILVGMIREVQSAEVASAAQKLQAREREEQSSAIYGKYVVLSHLDMLNVVCYSFRR